MSVMHSTGPARALTVAGLAALLVLGAAVPASAHGSDDAKRADRKLDAAIRQFVATDGGPPGIAVVVQRGRRPVLHAGGVAEVGGTTPPALDDHLRVASVAKAFSGATALSVVASRKLSLDSTIAQVRPDLPTQWGKVTLRQLLGHTSGIPDFSQTEAFAAAFGAALFDPPPPVELLSFVADKKLSFRPGTQYKYSNSDNIIVGLMIETATGVPYEQALQDRVAKPLGLRNTSLPRDEILPTPFVHGYAFDPENPSAPPEDGSEAFAAGWTWSSGGVVATPGDANRFARGYAAGRTTSSSVKKQQFRFRDGSSEPPGPGRNDAGLAIFRYKTRCGTVYGHTGNTLGYTHFLAATRDGSRSVSVATSSQYVPDRQPETFPLLRKIFELGVCAALA